jgi:hypothetical protein
LEQSKHYDGQLCFYRHLPVVRPRERSLIVAAALLSLAVCSYPLPVALRLLLRAPAQGFQLMLNTEFLISYFSLIYHLGG